MNEGSTVMPIHPLPSNPSGIQPTQFKCLIDPTPTETTTKGGLYLPDEVVTKQEFATTDGVIVAMSHLAFSYVTPDEWDGRKPKVGDRVIFTKYGGFRRKGRDGKDYLIIKDEDIHAVLED